MYENIDEAIDPATDYLPIAAEIFALLADPTRLRILLLLESGEVSVGRIAESVQKSQAAVSQHLAKLRMSRVVTARAEGARMFYRLSNEHAVDLIRAALYQAEHAVEENVRHAHLGEM